MKTAFFLFAQFESATLSITDVCKLLGDKATQTIRNRVSRGEFPRPLPDGVWRLQDVADYLDEQAASVKA